MNAGTSFTMQAMKSLEESFSLSQSTPVIYCGIQSFELDLLSESILELFLQTTTEKNLNNIVAIVNQLSKLSCVIGHKDAAKHAVFSVFHIISARL